MIEIIGRRSFIGSKMPVQPWSDRKTMLYLRWHGTDKEGRRSEVIQLGNEMALLACVDGLRERGVQRFVGVGSWAEQVRDTPYGNHKARAQKQSATLCHQLGGISHAWAQLFTVYGPGDKEENLIPTVIGKLLAGEEVRLDSCLKPWNFLYVNDAARALVDLARSQIEGVRQVVATAYPTVRDAVDTVREIIGAPKDAVVYANGDLLPGIAPYLKDVYAVKDATPLRSGLERTIEWIREH